jgi:hypothetical protein
MNQDITQILTDYFDQQRVIAVSDPWSRIMDGFLVRVHVSRWDGDIALGPTDLGLTREGFQDLDRALRWGHINLLDDELKRGFESGTTRARRLTRKWGRTVHWGEFVPLNAVPKFKADFAALEQEWNTTLEQWLDNYDSYRQEAERRAVALARQAAETAQRLGSGTVNVPAMVQRLMSQYPSQETIRPRFLLTYEASFIPTPTLEAEQAAYVEEVEQKKQQDLQRRRQEYELDLARRRRDGEIEAAAAELERLRVMAQISAEEAKQRDKLRLIREHKEQLSAELEQKKQRLLSEFYRGYALDIRQRLHESLVFLMEGGQKGKFHPSVTRSLRTVLEEIAVLAMDDDEEIQQMRQKLATITSGPKIKPATIAQDIEDLDVLLQSSILAMGETPRLPKGRTELPVDATTVLPQQEEMLRNDLRQRRERLGLDSSLAETLAEDGAELRRRNDRFDLAA